MIVADMGGNIVLLDLDGEVLWDRQLDGPLPPPTVGTSMEMANWTSL